jgi:hypothetical protein
MHELSKFVEFLTCLSNKKCVKFVQEKQKKKNNRKKRTSAGLIKSYLYEFLNEMRLRYATEPYLHHKYSDYSHYTKYVYKNFKAIIPHKLEFDKLKNFNAFLYKLFKTRALKIHNKKLELILAFKFDQISSAIQKRQIYQTSLINGK